VVSGVGPRVNWITCDDIGRVAAVLLLGGKTSNGKSYEVNEVVR